ncbi:MAG: enoyl-CoA hydratase/isomerase family protein, partial [Myxococcaceae bacterium]|nr:enoyl-CoA hydratase/isomerase family protein [Myxococcaceae bacterium]
AMEEAIQRCFAHARVEDVLQALVREGSAWAADVRATLTRMSPFGLKVTLALLRRGRALSYPEVVTLEYRLARACTSREDFHQGIRAVLVEKHGRPHWRPSTLEEVTEAMVEEAFRPLPPGEELVVA